MSELTDFQRGQIVGSQLGGMSVRDTAKMCDVSSRTVIKVMSVYNNYGHTPLVRKNPKVKSQTKKSTVEKASGEGEGTTGVSLLKRDEDKKITESSTEQKE
uniref:Paired domain-containing protein n=1 Tax=Hippocampus comes TaxID=109280 RepID=A0A3Q2XNH8_HIPCM